MRGFCDPRPPRSTESLGLVEQILRQPSRRDRSLLQFPKVRAKASALVEGFRGDIFVMVRLDAPAASRAAMLRDPSWFQWPLLEAAIEGNIVADFPLCNKSFNCSYSGHDL